MQLRNEPPRSRNRDNISVCICTYKRPELLTRLLNELQNQITDDLFTYSIVIVDNDHAQSAKGVVISFKGKSAVEIEYYNEPEQNIALVRNKAVQNAKGDFIAFIDDDEFPVNNWLLILYKALYAFKADGILGPVIPYYEIEPPKWVIEGKFYERPCYKTGLVIDWRKGRTGNVLLRKDIFNENENMFNPEFGSGAEDQDFFRRMISKGYTFVWCNDAVAYEYVPPIRWKRTFMLKRALLRGKVSIIHPTSGPLHIVKSLIAIPVYTLALPFLFFLGHHRFMKCLVKDFDHIGRILAFCGLDIIKQKYIME